MYPRTNYSQALIALIVMAALFALTIGSITAIAEAAAFLFRSVS